jgi:replicative DNA helicase
MTFDAKRVLKRYDPEERTSLLDALLEEAKPREKPKSRLISLAETWEEALKLHGDERGIGGLSTGYDSIDDITGGLRPGQLIIIFGDTGHGKSMFAQNIAYNIASAGTPVLFIGLEMPPAENTERFQGIGADPTLPILYPEVIDLEVKHIEFDIQDAISLKAELVIIDHLHMFEGLTQENEAQFITAICREVKMLAIKYNIPILLLSHIKERLPGQEKNIPQLRDLKGSSSIKQLADSALAVFNESMVFDDLPGQAQLIVKQRKSRRGRQQTLAKLDIMPNARLVEPKPTTQWGGLTTT